VYWSEAAGPPEINILILDMLRGCSMNIPIYSMRIQNIAGPTHTASFIASWEAVF
jgi:hypothetical protein